MYHARGIDARGTAVAKMEPMKDDFEKKLAKEQQEGLRRCLTEEPPPGMRQDGTLNVVEPGLPRQKPTIRLTRKLVRAIAHTGAPRHAARQRLAGAGQ